MIAWDVVLWLQAQPRASVFALLADVAERERRPVRDQAGLLLERMLKRRTERHGAGIARVPALVSQNSEA